MNRTERAFETKRRALDAIGLMRAEGRTLTAAAAEAGTTPATVRRLAAPALNRNGRTYAVTKSDRIARSMSVLTADGSRVVTIRSSNKAREVAQHWNAVKRYLGGDKAALAPFEGKKVAGVTLATDEPTVMAFGRAGDPVIDDIYAIPA